MSNKLPETSIEAKVGRANFDRVNPVGESYGMLMVISKTQYIKQKNKSNDSYTYTGFVFVKCECGNIKRVRYGLLRSGHTKSCGCYNAALLKNNKRTIKHGNSHRDEFLIWNYIKRRCCNINCAAYNDYGGRGITICDRWLYSFDNFFADMGMRPSKKHSIDRYPNTNGNYEPTNCRWATPKQQANNKTNNRIIEFEGSRKTISEWCDIYSIGYKTVYHRLSNGWEIGRALTTPLLKSKYDSESRFMQTSFSR